MVTEGTVVTAEDIMADIIADITVDITVDIIMVDGMVDGVVVDGVEAIGELEQRA